MTRLARRQGLPPSAYTEKEWQRQVTELLKLYHWDWWYHVTQAQYSPWGWPDLAAVRRRDRRLLFAELKSESGRATPDQLAVLELLLDVSRGGATDSRVAWPIFGTESLLPGLVRVDVELWRPSDIDRVMEVLK